MGSFGPYIPSASVLAAACTLCAHPYIFCAWPRYHQTTHISQLRRHGIKLAGSLSEARDRVFHLSATGVDRLMTESYQQEDFVLTGSCRRSRTRGVSWARTEKENHSSRSGQSIERLDNVRAKSTSVVEGAMPCPTPTGQHHQHAT